MGLICLAFSRVIVSAVVIIVSAVVIIRDIVIEEYFV
jgi:hypothetical protein